MDSLIPKETAVPAPVPPEPNPLMEPSLKEQILDELRKDPTLINQAKREIIADLKAKCPALDAKKEAAAIDPMEEYEKGLPKSDRALPSKDRKGKVIDYLDEDRTIPGQEFVCVSFLSPEGIKNCTIRGVKFRGAFHTLEEAQAHAKRLHSLDEDFHIYVGEGFKWLPWEPDPSKVKDEVFHNEELNELARAHKENQVKAKDEHELRIKREKERMKEEELDRRSSEKEKQKERMRKKLAQRKLDSKVEEEIPLDEVPKKKNKVKEAEKAAKEKSKDAKKVGKEYSSLHEKISKKEKEQKDIEANLQKIQALYAKLKKKEKKV